MQSESRVLDVAAGYGEPALTAARKAGPGGRVVATDISAEMLGFGRERAAAAGLGNVEFVESDASSLDFPPASFDAAVSRWGIIFEPDAEAAAGRIRGFLKPGARMAIAVMRAGNVMSSSMLCGGRGGLVFPPKGDNHCDNRSG